MLTFLWAFGGCGHPRDRARRASATHRFAPCASTPQPRRNPSSIWVSDRTSLSFRAVLRCPAAALELCGTTRRSGAAPHTEAWSYQCNTPPPYACPRRIFYKVTAAVGTQRAATRASKYRAAPLCAHLLRHHTARRGAARCGICGLVWRGAAWRGAECVAWCEICELAWRGGACEGWQCAALYGMLWRGLAHMPNFEPCRAPLHRYYPTFDDQDASYCPLCHTKQWCEDTCEALNSCVAYDYTVEPSP